MRHTIRGLARLGDHENARRVVRKGKFSIAQEAMEDLLKADVTIEEVKDAVGLHLARFVER